MPLKIEHAALAILNVLVGSLLVTLFSIGVAELHSGAQLLVLLVAVLVVGFLAIEPYRLLGV